MAGSDLDVHAVRVSVDGGRERRLPARWLAGGACVIAGVVLGALVIGRASGTHRRLPVVALAPLRSDLGVASAYAYSGRCLRVTILASHPDYARVDLNHGSECRIDTGYTTAVFRHANGVWLEVLDDAQFTCPVGTIPRPVQSALGVCAGTGPPVRARAH
jgi:hypothetical protein